MRALAMNVLEAPQEREKFDLKVLDDYARRFSQHSELHIRALAALFGLTPPEEMSGVGTADCLV